MSSIDREKRNERRRLRYAEKKNRIAAAASVENARPGGVPRRLTIAKEPLIPLIRSPTISERRTNHRATAQSYPLASLLERAGYRVPDQIRVREGLLDRGLYRLQRELDDEALAAG